MFDLQARTVRPNHVGARTQVRFINRVDAIAAATIANERAAQRNASGAKAGTFGTGFFKAVPDGVPHGARFWTVKEYRG